MRSRGKCRRARYVRSVRGNSRPDPAAVVGRVRELLGIVPFEWPEPSIADELPVDLLSDMATTLRVIRSPGR